MPCRTQHSEASPFQRLGRAFVILVAALLALRSPPAIAQCPGRWLPGEGLPGVNGTVYAVASLNTGDTIAAGTFTGAGNLTVAYIARWNASTSRWSPVGPGLDGPVFAAAIVPGGDLIVGGAFAHGGGTPLPGIARLNPATNTWSALGSGITGGDVNVIAVAPTGEVYAAGSFSSAGGISVAGIAQWSPATGQWSSLGQSPNRGFNAIAVHPSGDVYVGGSFGPGGFSANGIARWSPQSQTWSTLGAGLLGGAVNAIAILPSGDVVAGGQFLTVAGASGFSAPGIARWNPSTSTWSPLGTGIAGQARRINTLLTLPGGDLLAAGDFSTAGGSPAVNVAKWSDASGGAWSAVGGGTNGPVTSLAAISAGPSAGQVIVGGEFSIAAGASTSAPGALPVGNLARLIPASETWSAYGSGISGSVNAITAISSEPGAGDLVVGGSFLRAGPIAAANIARWNPTSGDWATLGSGLNGIVNAVAAIPGGDIVVGGQFTTAGGITANRVARWNVSTSTWSALGTGITAPTTGARVLALGVLPNGNIVAGGGFTNVGPTIAIDIAMWNATTSTWSAMGSGLDGLVYAIAPLPNGDVIVGGAFSASGSTTLSGIARWNAVSRTWSPLGPGVNGTVYALTVVPAATGTQVIVAGEFTTAGGVSANSIAAWNADSASWSSLGAFGSGVDPVIFAVAALPATPGDLIVGGSFSTAGGVPAQRIARWSAGAHSWSQFGPAGGAAGGSVYAIAALFRGDVLIGGAFGTVGGQPSPYFARWTTQPACPADFNCSGQIEIDDLFVYLNSFLAGSPAADFNGVGGTTVQDIFDFIAAWFAPC